MKKVIYSVILFFIFNATYSVGITAFEKEDKNILELLQKIEFADWQEKDKVVKQMRQENLILSYEAKTKFIVLFKKETNFQGEYIENLKRQGVPESKARDNFNNEYRNKGYVQYYSELASVVSSFKDIRAVSPFLKGLHYYGGAIVPTHIVAIGESAVEPLLDALMSQDRVLRNTASFVLSVWVNAPIATEDYTITEDMRIKGKMLLDKIRDSFLKDLLDKDIDIRSSAVFGLSAFPEETVIRELENIAENDPYSYFSKYENKMKYPIREDAKKSIEKIKAKLNK